MMRHNTAFHKSVCTATLISSVTLSYHPMATMLYPARGTRLYDYGIWLLAKPLADSKTIPRCEEKFYFFLISAAKTLDNIVVVVDCLRSVNATDNRDSVCGLREGLDVK